MRLRRQERRVRRQRQLRAERGEHRDQPLHVLAHERLAAGQAQLLDPERDRGPRDALDLLEREQFLAVEEAIAGAEDRLRHAVDAAEVAAVGDGDTEVAQRASEPVERHGGSVDKEG
jgi:hypothetical protein